MIEGGASTPAAISLRHARDALLVGADDEESIAVLRAIERVAQSAERHVVERGHLRAVDEELSRRGWSIVFVMFIGSGAGIATLPGFGVLLRVLVGVGTALGGAVMLAAMSGRWRGRRRVSVVGRVGARDASGAITFRYAYDGVERTGAMRDSAPALAARLHDGAVVGVLVDPGKPERADAFVPEGAGLPPMTS